MLFNRRTVTLILATFFLSSCVKEEISNKKTGMMDQFPREKIEEVFKNSIRPSSSNKYNSKYLKIKKLIQDKHYKSAKKLLEDEIYRKDNLNKSVYTAPSYTGYIHLYSTLLVKLDDTKDKNNENIQLSLDKFYNHFLKSCLDLSKAESNCELLKYSLSKEVSVANILHMIADREEGLLQKIKIFGAIFEISKGTKIKKLEEDYLYYGVILLDKFEKGHFDLSKNFLKIHTFNILSIAAQTDWSQDNKVRTGQFETIKPWDQSRSSSILNDLRKILLPFIPLYIYRSNLVKSEIKKYLEEEVKKLKNKKKELSPYPSYRSIRIEDLLNDEIPVEISYLVTYVYFQKINSSESHSYFSNIKGKEKEFFANKSFEIFKLLVRWDVAQLGIDSTEKLHERFSQQKIKTQSFLQEVLDWSQKLIPLWDEFHEKRARRAREFLESISRHSRQFNEFDVQQFFLAANRSIMKTTVYPNMMAFAFYMAKTEWTATINILWFSIDIKTQDIVDRMMTGQYRRPWFNFTNLKESSQYPPPDRVDLKRTLFRSEMYDALYYFFTTKTNQIYKINADDFLHVIGKFFTKERKSLFEKKMEIQRENLIHENSSFMRMSKWCEGIKSGNFQEERILFYTLSHYITPSTAYNVYGSDLLTNGLSKTDDYMELPDRYRLEIQPIIHTLEQYISITERIRSSYPDLNIGSLNKIKGYAEELEFMSMNFLGMQKMLSKKIEECVFIGEKESRRRIIGVTFAHYDYFRKVVHPLMKKIKNGVIDLNQANLILKDFHGDLWREGVLDKFEWNSFGSPVFIASQLTYMLRTRKFLTSGVDFYNHHTSRVKIDPVFRGPLEIPVPSNFMNDPDNKFLPQFITESKVDAEPSNIVFFKFEFEENPLYFAQSVSRATTDTLRSDMFSREKFTVWDFADAHFYIASLFEHLKYKVTLLQIMDQKYIDIENPNCRVRKMSDVQEECVIEEYLNLKDIAKMIKDILEIHVIKGDRVDYMKLIAGESWVGDYSFGTMFRYDPNMPYDYYRPSALPFRKLAGLFDQVYEMLKQDYLGIIYGDPWPIRREELNPSPESGTPPNCKDWRSGCYWKNERHQALEFFYSRVKRAKIIFNYDIQIISDDFEYHRKNITYKYNRLTNLVKRGDELVQYIKDIGGYEKSVRVSMSIERSELKPLSKIYLIGHQRNYDTFFVDQTEGFFLQDSKKIDWNQFLIQ